MTDLKICSSDITLEEIQEFCAMIENSGLGPCVLYLENAWLSCYAGLVFDKSNVVSAMR